MGHLFIENQLTLDAFGDGAHLEELAEEFGDIDITLPFHIKHGDIHPQFTT